MPNGSFNNNDEKSNTTDRISRYTLWLVFIGAIAAVIGLGNLFVIRDQLDAMRDEQRAWIAVTGIYHDQAFKFDIDRPIYYFLEFENVGKTVATNIKIHVDNGFIDTPSGVLDVARTFFSEDVMCSTDKWLVPGGIVFPEPAADVYITNNRLLLPALPVNSAEINGAKVIGGMLNGTKTFFVRGCIHYSAGAGKSGASRFCLFVRPYFAATNNSGGAAVSTLCREGNQAE